VIKVFQVDFGTDRYVTLGAGGPCHFYQILPIFVYPNYCYRSDKHTFQFLQVRLHIFCRSDITARPKLMATNICIQGVIGICRHN